MTEFINEFFTIPVYEGTTQITPGDNIMELTLHNNYTYAQMVVFNGYNYYDGVRIGSGKTLILKGQENQMLKDKVFFTVINQSGPVVLASDFVKLSVIKKIKIK